MANLYTPPQWRNFQMMEGSLRYSIPTSFCVYKKAGVWKSVQTPGIDELTGATVVFYTPTIVDDATKTELLAFGVGTITIV